MNERPRGNVLRDMNDDEALESIAVQQMFGCGRWEYLEGDTPYCGSTSPEVSWEEKKAALAAARVYREMAPILKDMSDALAGIRNRFSEDHPEEVLGEDELHALGRTAGETVYRLSGVLRDGCSSDDMDIFAPGLFETVYREIMRLSEESGDNG